MRVWVPDQRYWITVERATPDTKREDDAFWHNSVSLFTASRSGRESMLRLKRRVENAGYRTTFVLPPNRRENRRLDPNNGRRVMRPSIMLKILGESPHQVSRWRFREGPASHTVNGNTKFYGTNFTNVNSRNIPIDKRVYIQKDVGSNGKIKHVYNSDGLERWIQSQGSSATSPLTRRKITMGDIRKLRTSHHVALL